MLPTILAIVAIAILALLAYIATRPPGMQIQRKGAMAAPAAVVFAQVNDFHNWVPWSPWENRDPDLQRTYSGPTAGIGAGYAWVGNKSVGEGRMTIVESKPSEFIRIKLEFLKPFAATNETVFTFTPEGGGTLVTWTMTGKNNFMAKAMHLFMNMDKMVGGDFEKGLASMKALVETAARG